MVVNLGGLQEKKGISRILLIVALCFSFAFFKTAETVSAQEDEIDYSMYWRAAEVAQAFDEMMAPSDGEVGSSPWVSQSVQPGAAGGLLGYPEQHEEGSIRGYIANTATGSSVSYTFDQLRQIDNNASEDGTKGNLTNYAIFGSRLTSNGYAEMRPEADMSFLTRALMGWMLTILYLLSSVAPLVMNLAIDVLAALNPFRLLGVITGAFAESNLLGPLFNPIADFLTSIYDALSNVALIGVFPVLIGVTLFMVFAYRRVGYFNSFLRVFVRFFIIVAGLPIVGTTYTSFIDGMSASSMSSNIVGDYMVMSTLVDFQGWVEHSRLEWPDLSETEGSNWLTESDDIEAPKRDQVMSINANATGGMGYRLVYDELNGIGDIGNVLIKNPNGESNDINAGTSMRNRRRASLSLLERYRSGARYTSADYESYISSDIDRILRTSDESAVNSVDAMFEPDSKDFVKNEDNEYSDIFKIGKTSEAFNEEGFNPSYTIYNGHRDAENLVSKGVQRSDSKARAVAKSNSAGNGGGLSPLAMYNFLNTQFSPETIMIQSPARTNSPLTKLDYSAVTMAGGGTSGGLMVFIQAVSILGSLIAIAAFYGFALIRIGITTIPKVLSSLSGIAVMGSFAAITKLLTVMAMLFVEVIGVVFLYQVSEVVILAIIRGIDSFAAIFGSMPAGLNALNGYFAQLSGVESYSPVTEIISPLLSSFLIVAATVFLVRNRKLFVNTIEEITGNAIEHFMSVMGGQLGQGSIMHNQGAINDAARQARGISENADKMGVLDEFKDALDDEIDKNQKRAALYEQDPDNNVAPLSQKDMLKNALDSTKKRQKAKGQDSVANALPVGAGMMLGSAVSKGLGREAGNEIDMTGRAYDGLQFKEELDKDQLGAQHRFSGTNLGSNSTEMYSEQNMLSEDSYMKSTETDFDVDESGNRVDSLGRAVDADGNIISDEEGNLINPDGSVRTDASGSPLTLSDHEIDDQGRLLNEQGEPITDNGLRIIEDDNGEFSHYENNQGERVDSKGNIIDEDGKVIKTLDDDRLPNGELIADKGALAAGLTAGYLTSKALNEGVSVNEEGQLVDKNGEVVDNPEQHLNEDGKERFVINEKGELVNKDTGQSPLNQRGLSVSKTPAESASALTEQYISDESRENGVRFNKQGQLMNKEGKVIENPEQHLSSLGKQVTSVSSNGALMTESGLNVVEHAGRQANSPRFKDATGAQVNAMGERVNDNGFRVTGGGQVMNSRGDVLGQDGSVLYTRKALTADRANTFNQRAALKNLKTNASGQLSSDLFKQASSALEPESQLASQFSPSDGFIGVNHSANKILSGAAGAMAVSSLTGGLNSNAVEQNARMGGKVLSNQASNADRRAFKQNLRHQFNEQDKIYQSSMKEGRNLLQQAETLKREGRTSDANRVVGQAMSAFEQGAGAVNNATLITKTGQREGLSASNFGNGYYANNQQQIKRQFRKAVETAVTGSVRPNGGSQAVQNLSGVKVLQDRHESYAKPINSNQSYEDEVQRISQEVNISSRKIEGLKEQLETARPNQRAKLNKQLKSAEGVLAGQKAYRDDLYESEPSIRQSFIKSGVDLPKQVQEQVFANPKQLSSSYSAVVRYLQDYALVSKAANDPRNNIDRTMTRSALSELKRELLKQGVSPKVFKSDRTVDKALSVMTNDDLFRKESK